MRNLVAIFAVLCCMSESTLAQSAKPQIILEHPAPSTSAIVIPGGSSMRLASFPPDIETNATFRGRFTLSGTYELDTFEDNFVLTIWPDRKSRNLLPYWRGRDRPDEIYFSDAAAFAQAVLPKDKLQSLRANKLPSVHGRVTIIAEDYETSIECDVASFSARFVSVVEAPVRIAAKPKSEHEC